VFHVEVPAASHRRALRVGMAVAVDFTPQNRLSQPFGEGVVSPLLLPTMQVKPALYEVSAESNPPRATIPLQTHFCVKRL
jgi:hypothetical protein